jgi:hypothetical protein
MLNAILYKATILKIDLSFLKTVPEVPSSTVLLENEEKISGA